MSCHIIVMPPCPIPVCPEQIVYASENANITGVGVLDANTSSLGRFRGIVGDGVYISTTLDDPNNAIVVSLIAAAIPGAIPQATESVSGKAEVATQAETDAGVSDTVMVTPLKLRASAASTTMRGVVELATNGETAAFSSGTLAVTPQGLGLVINAIKGQQTWANAAARAAATPDFDGQVGVQRDTEQVFTATGLAAGNWQQSYLQPNTTTTLTANTTVDMDGHTWTFDDGTFTLGAAASLNLGLTTLLKINNVSIGADSLLGTGAVAGQPVGISTALFLSAYNTEATWDTPSGTLARTTFDQSTVTLPELAKRVAALITDLLAVKLPATP